jgi:hypothetical protein
MWLSVHPDHQSRGLGGALLAEIERDPCERGCTELLVHATETGDGGGASPHFAARCGFRETLLTLDELVQAAVNLPPERPAELPSGTLVARNRHARDAHSRRSAGRAVELGCWWSGQPDLNRRPPCSQNWRTLSGLPSPV